MGVFLYGLLKLFSGLSGPGKLPSFLSLPYILNALWRILPFSGFFLTARIPKPLE